MTGLGDFFKRNKKHLKKVCVKMTNGEVRRVSIEEAWNIVETNHDGRYVPKELYTNEQKEKDIQPVIEVEEHVHIHQKAKDRKKKSKA